MSLWLCLTLLIQKSLSFPNIQVSALLNIVETYLLDS
jgi:hypothetical protein